jgi:hypothetical protein
MMEAPAGYVLIYDQGHVYLVRIEDYNIYVPPFVDTGTQSARKEE